MDWTIGGFEGQMLIGEQILNMEYENFISVF